MSLSPNHFYLESKLPESMFLVQSVYHCTPEPRIVSGTLNEREKEWISKSLHNIRAFLLLGIVLIILIITLQGG